MAAPNSNITDTAALKDLWDRTVDRVKKVAFSPMLYRALEKTVPIAYEDNTFVVGFSGTDGQMAGAMNTGENLAVMERALRALTGSADTRLRVIDGSSYSDWQNVKERDAAALASRTQTHQRRTTESAALGSWEQVYEQVSRLWATSDNRALPIGRARFFDAAFDMVIKAMSEGLYPAEGAADELTERGLSRIIERIAGMASADTAIVGYLLLERWKARAK